MDKRPPNGTKTKLPSGWTGVRHDMLVRFGDESAPTPSAGAFLTLLILRAHCINGNPCTASLSRLAQIQGTTRRTAQRHISDLVALGLITVQGRLSGNGNTDTNEIRLTSEGREWFHSGGVTNMSRGDDRNVTGGDDNFVVEGVTFLTPKEELREEEKSEEEMVHSPNALTPGDKRKRKTVTDPRIKIILDHFHDEHLRIHGEKPHIIGGRDSSAAKRLLKTIPDADELKHRITAYLNDQLSWMDRPQWTLSGFEKRVNSYADTTATRPAGGQKQTPGVPQLPNLSGYRG